MSLLIARRGDSYFSGGRRATLAGDGGHTIRVSAETLEEIVELTPKAKARCSKIVETCGNKAQMRQLAIDKEPARLKNAREIPAEVETRSGEAPICPMHNKPMWSRRGVYGTFWSCSVRSPVGRWCSFTKEVDSDGDKKASA